MSSTLPFASDAAAAAVEIEIEIPYSVAEIEIPDTAAPAAPVPVERSLMAILPADFPLPLLTRFVPDAALKASADQASRYALSLEVREADGIRAADVALTALRTSQKAIIEHFAEPAELAHRLHKRLTGVRGEWLETGETALRTVGTRIYNEQRRLEAIVAEQRRQAQADADRRAREQARREAEQAAQAKAPAPIVQELQRQAETATAAPVHVPAAAPVLQGSTTMTTWKARLLGTPGDAEPNPKVAELTVPQREYLRILLQAILDDKAPCAAIEINWSVLNGRAKADKATLAIPGIEAFPEGGVRAKARR